jgi:hypothetical protein
MLDFIQELNEARMYRGTDTLKGKKADDLAKVAFLMIMMLEILRDLDADFVKKYAYETMSYDNFEHMRSNATDLHNLLVVLSNQTNFEDKIKVNPKISAPILQLKRYLRDLTNHSKDHSQDRQMFMKLEGFFNISDSIVKHIRRSVGDWATCSHTEKQDICRYIKNALQNQNQQNDLFTQFKNKTHI